MKLRYFFATALLGLASCLAAHAQAPTVTRPPAAPAPAAGSLPGNVMANPVPASATSPTSPETANPLYTNGVPARNIDGGTQRANQLYGGKAAVSGSHNTRSLNHKRTTTPTTATQP